MHMHMHMHMHNHMHNPTLPLPLALSLTRHTTSLPSLVFLSPDGSEEVGKVFVQARQSK